MLRSPASALAAAAVAALAVVALPRSAHAQYDDEIASAWLEGEAGVASFNRDLSGRMKVGPGWGLRMTAPLTPLLSAVLGYGGALTRISGPGVSGTPMVTSSAAYLAAQLDFAAGYSVHPLVSAGIGLMRNSVPGRAQYVFQSDNAGIVPLSLGVLVDVSDRIGVGARLNYMLTFGNQMQKGTNNLTADLWSTTVTLAYHLL